MPEAELDYLQPLHATSSPAYFPPGWDQAGVQRPQGVEAHVGGHDENEPGRGDSEVLHGDTSLPQTAPAALQVVLVRRTDTHDHRRPSLAAVGAGDLHGNVLPERDASDACAGIEARDVRARALGREGVAHVDLYAGLLGGLHGPGMEDLRAEAREDAGLPVGEARHQGGAGHQARVCVQNAVHVGHDPDLRRAQRPP